MKNILTAGLIALVALSLTLASCEKRQEDRLAETWRLIRVSIDSTVTWYELWQFDGSNVTMLTRDAASSNLDTVGTGTYTVNTGLSKTIISMQDFANTTFNGDWEVLKMNKEMMVILNNSNGGWVYREFVKE